MPRTICTKISFSHLIAVRAGASERPRRRQNKREEKDGEEENAILWSFLKSFLRTLNAWDAFRNIFAELECSKTPKWLKM